MCQLMGYPSKIHKVSPDNQSLILSIQHEYSDVEPLGGSIPRCFQHFDIIAAMLYNSLDMWCPGYLLLLDDTKIFDLKKKTE